MVNREYGHRFADGSGSADESREAVLTLAARFQPGFVEVVFRDGPDEPWQRDGDQPHTPDERMDQLAEFARTMGHLADWRGQKLVDLGLASTPSSWTLTEDVFEALMTARKGRAECACYRSPFDHEYGCPHAVFVHAGVTYPLGKQYLDRVGVRWAFYGENDRGAPLVKLFPFHDAYEPLPLAVAVDAYGPFTAVDPLPEEGLF